MYIKNYGCQERRMEAKRTKLKPNVEKKLKEQKLKQNGSKAQESSETKES